MTGATALRAGLGLLPVLSFLVALVAMDSYKLVRLRLVAAVIAAGAVAAGLAYVANGSLLAVTGLGMDAYSRTLAPLVEEALKAIVVIALVRAHRIGFLVDAAILGFAVGTGFALVENLAYLQRLFDAPTAVWIVRGFGTALLHGGVQSIFAVWLLSRAERRGGVGPVTIAIPLLAAAALHATFNQFVLPPVWQTLVLLVVLPPLMMLVFARSEAAVRGWLGDGFDADRDLLALLDSGGFHAAPQGQYLQALRAHFRGEVVADLLCYLRLHVELALRAKGVLMMREEGIDMPIDEATRARFEEMRYLEATVGPTAVRSLKPLLHMSRRDLWQLYMLGK
ncbi:MAG: PrsW family glutamic-type intramembrane protease [Arenimonas sp.]